jgi:hypothetical protein
MPGQLYDIPEWCVGARISRTKYYSLKAAGKGPREVLLGCSVRITESPLQYGERIAKERAQGGGS